MREAHVPAEQPKAQEDPRLPVPHANPGRSGGAQGPTPARPQAPLGLIWRVRDRATFDVLARAERHARGPVTIRFVPGESDAPPRVAYAVGGVGNAVVRNRLRRRLRAAVATRRGGAHRRRGLPRVRSAGGADDAVRRPRRGTRSIVQSSRRAPVSAVVDVAPTTPVRRGPPLDAADPGVAPGERAPAAPVPLSPVVLGVRARSARATRRVPRPVARGPPAGALPPWRGGGLDPVPRTHVRP